MVSSFAVAPGSGDFHILLECVLGNCHEQGSSLRLILRGGRFEDFLGKSFRKEPNPLKTVRSDHAFTERSGDMVYTFVLD